MSLQYDDLNCPRLEKALKSGAKLGIFRSGDISMLTRLQNNSKLIASDISDSLRVVLKKTDWDLNPDKLVCKMPFFRKYIERSALERLVERGYFLGFDAQYDLLKGYILDPNKHIICIKKSLKDISSLLQLLELEAIKFI